jgi:hypothetical protein
MNFGQSFWHSRRCLLGFALARAESSRQIFGKVTDGSGARFCRASQ